jgi:hypothetical protein
LFGYHKDFRIPGFMPIPFIEEEAGSQGAGGVLCKLGNSSQVSIGRGTELVPEHFARQRVRMN